MSQLVMKPWKRNCNDEFDYKSIAFYDYSHSNLNFTTEFFFSVVVDAISENDPILTSNSKLEKPC